MGDYLRIARAYLCGTAAAVWCFMFLCLLGVSATNVEELARNQGGMLVGVLSRKSYMAMFVYFNACLLGVLLRDNIAHPWASVLPHYRKKHLVVATLITLHFLGIPMFSMEFVGTSDIAPTSVAVCWSTPPSRRSPCPSWKCANAAVDEIGFTSSSPWSWNETWTNVPSSSRITM